MDNSTYNTKGFELITEKTMSIVNKKKVVLPSSYRVVFSTMSKKYNVDIGAEHIRSEDEISDEVLKYIASLDSNTSSAIDAIENEDKESLKKVLEETLQLKKELNKLKHEVYEDTLTKTLNRKWLIKKYFNEDTEEFNRDGFLVMVDMNDFKFINDTYGHAIGDQVLINVASRLNNIDGEVIRYGGDEFLLMFEKENNTTDEIHNILHTVRELLMKSNFKNKDTKFKTSFAFGITDYSANTDFSEVLENADKELYKDKEKIKQRLTS